MAERMPNIEDLLLEGIEAIENGEVKEMTTEDWQKPRAEYQGQLAVENTLRNRS